MTRSTCETMIRHINCLDNSSLPASRRSLELMVRAIDLLDIAVEMRIGLIPREMASVFHADACLAAVFLRVVAADY